jgi:hypothetical protein
MKKFVSPHIILFALLAVALSAAAQPRENLLNRPYADLKRLHFGFSVGMHFQDLNLVNNGFITPEGESWFTDVPDYSPGFCVNVLADLRISTHFNLRFSPGMYFGNKVIKFHNVTNGDMDKQNVKSNYVVLPLDLKISALRYRNMRPYFVTGVMATYDVSKKRSEQLQFTNNDVMLTVGLGSDFYMQYFKFCPELKFCFGLRNLLKTDRPDLQDNPGMMKYTQSVAKATSNMVVLTFYFE